MGGISHLRSALLYLDDADWDLSGAIQQHRFEEEDRLSEEQSPVHPAATTDSNKDLDRKRASGGANWDEKKLQVRIKVGTSSWKDRNFLDVASETFNETAPCAKDILRLNKWRHHVISTYAGPAQPHAKGARWHPIAEARC